jgi:hypothetical protein
MAALLVSLDLNKPRHRGPCRHELEITATELFPRSLRRVELLQHDDAPMIEPGQLMPRLVFADPVSRLAASPRDTGAEARPGGRAAERPDPRKAAKAARTFKLAIGPKLSQFRGHLLERWPEIVDTLIAAGIANNRAEAIRWALTRVRERPAYEQLREHTRDIERLKSEF